MMNDIDAKAAIRATFGAKLNRLRPGKLGRGWFDCGPLVKYLVVGSAEGVWAVIRFTPDRDGVFRGFEQWHDGHYYGRRCCPLPAERWRHLLT